MAVLRPLELQLEVFLGNIRCLNNDKGWTQINHNRDNRISAYVRWLSFHVSRVPVFFLLIIVSCWRHPIFSDVSNQHLQVAAAPGTLLDGVWNWDVESSRFWTSTTLLTDLARIGPKRQRQLVVFSCRLNGQDILLEEQRIEDSSVQSTLWHS